MSLVVADTSPIFYLLCIGNLDLLPQLFEKVVVPVAVYNELAHPFSSSRRARLDSQDAGLA
jgi:predicted nucleic acid-binding protein